MIKKLFVFLFISVNVFSLTWNATQILSDEGSNSYEPQIALNSLGAAVIVWSQYIDGKYLIQARSSEDYGATFSSVVTISNPAKSATDPKVVIDEAGNAIAIWKYIDGSHLRIQESHKDGQLWSSPTYLSPAGNNAEVGEIAITADSKTVVIWKRDNITKKSVIGEKHSIDGGKNWSANETILSSVDIHSDDPKIFVGDSNVTIAVWRELGDSCIRVAERHSSDFGDNWTEKSFISEDQEYAQYPRISGDSAGHAVVCWVANKFIIKMNRTADKGETWLETPVTLSTETRLIEELQVAMNQAKAMVIWNRDYVGSQATVLGRVSSDYGQNWAPVIDVSEVGKNVIKQTVSVNALGNIIVAWVEYSTDHYQVVEIDSLDGLTWSAKVVMDGSVRYTAKPFIATSADGNVIGSWNTYDSSHFVIKEATSSF